MVQEVENKQRTMWRCSTTRKAMGGGWKLETTTPAVVLGGGQSSW
jgi:hypothetical protein